MKQKILKILSKKERIQEPIVITMGFMDCVHLGHRRLLEVARQKARDIGAVTAVFTFSSDPFKVLGKDIRLIYDFDTRVKLIDADYIIYADFDKKFAELSGEEFIDSLLAMADVRVIVAGADYTYGKNGECKTSHLKTQLAKKHGDKNIELIIEPLVLVKDVLSQAQIEEIKKTYHIDPNEKVSSTTIRKLLKYEYHDIAALFLGKNTPLI